MVVPLYSRSRVIMQRTLDQYLARNARGRGHAEFVSELYLCAPFSNGTGATSYFNRRELSKTA
jgi:hypothetical protein